MKLIKPAEISAKIMTLIDEAEKELIIISPYNKITGWDKLIIRIKKAQAKGITISWYSRKNNVDDNNTTEVKKNLGIEPILINDLHAKIYMNEVSAIFTSMNMSKISDEKSLDLGYITEKSEEYDEISRFFKKHIERSISSDKVKELIPEIHPRTVSQIEKPIKKISSLFYVNCIHEHILRNYGIFKYHYIKDQILEYFDFVKPGYKIQFMPYSQAIKVHIFLPVSKPLISIEKTVNKNYNKLTKLNEVESYYNDDGKFLKYYFEVKYSKINEWDMNLLRNFFKDFDILVEIVFDN